MVSNCIDELQKGLIEQAGPKYDMKAGQIAQKLDDDLTRIRTVVDSGVSQTDNGYVTQY